MSGVISGYPTTTTGAEEPCNVTTTNETGDKCALDVAVKSGSVTGEFTPSGLKDGGLYTAVTIDDSSWTALPATALTGRNQINIQNFTGFEIKINHKNTGGYANNGMRIVDSSERFYQITDALVIYARAESGAGSVVLDIEEIA